MLMEMEKAIGQVGLAKMTEYAWIKEFTSTPHYKQLVADARADQMLKRGYHTLTKWL